MGGVDPRRGPGFAVYNSLLLKRERWLRCSMPTLLCILDEAEHLAATCHQLAFLFGPHFSRVDVVADLEDIDDLSEYSHVWVFGGPEYLSSVASYWDNAQLLKGTALFAWVALNTPFVPTGVARLFELFDFVVTCSGMAAAALKANVRPVVGDSKAMFRGFHSVYTILPGADTTVFRPLDRFAHDFGREELRGQFFGNTVLDADYLVLTHDNADVAIAMATVRQLDQLIDRNVKLLIRNCRYTEYDRNLLTLLAEGNELIIGRDVLLSDESATLNYDQTNLLLNAADLYLCTDTSAPWPVEIHEAMTAGLVVAAPNDHVWLETISGDCGIELPTPLLEQRNGGFVRRTSPESAAMAVAKALTSEQYKQLSRRGAAWAAKYSLPRCASEWLRLFGMVE